MTDEETVCLNDEQMKNIIEAARADESGDKNRIKKACPKAYNFVTKYAPKKKLKKEPKDAIESLIDRKISSRINRFLEELF